VSRRGDDYDEMSDDLGVPTASAAGSAGEQDDVARFLVEMRALGEGDPPAPSAELAALLSGATPLRTRRPLYRVAARSALVAAACIVALVVAAASHSLPQPAQRVVSDFVDVLTPFEIAPDHTIAPSLTPSPTPTRTKPVVGPPADESSPGGSDDGTSSGGGSDDGTSSGGGSDDGTSSGGGSDDGATSGSGSDDGTSSAPRTSGDGEVREAGDD
jgi:hypothetical protein